MQNNKRGVLGIRFWFLVLIFFVFMIAINIMTRVIDFGQAINAGTELERIKSHVTPVCQGVPGDFREFSSVPSGVFIRCDPCATAMTKGAIRGAIGVATVAKNIKDIMDIGKDVSRLKRLSRKADDIATSSHKGINTAQNIDEIKDANRAVAGILENFKDPGKELLEIPAPSGIRGVYNKVVVAVDKGTNWGVAKVEVDRKIAQIYRVQHDIQRVQGLMEAVDKTSDAAKWVEYTSQLETLYKTMGAHSDEAFKLLRQRNLLTQGGKYLKGALYLSCLGTTLSDKAGESNLLSEATKQQIDSFRQDAKDIVARNAGPLTDAAANTPPENTACAVYALSRGVTKITRPTAAFAGVIGGAAFNILGGEALGDGINIMTSLATKCGISSKTDLALCVAKKECRGKGLCSACDVVKCNAEVVCKSRPMDTKIEAEFTSQDEITISGGVENF